MRDILEDIDQWLAKNKKIGIATVIQTWGSSPRGVGARMAFTTDGKISGSVSGGCVEGAVVEAGQETLQTGRPQFLHFGVSDESAWNVGLACGGQVDVFVAPLEESSYQLQRQRLLAGRSFATATIVRGPLRLLGLELFVSGERRPAASIPPGLDEVILERARQVLLAGHSQVIRLQTPENEEIDVFVEVVQPQPALVIVGGVHIAVALAELARTMGFRTVVVDPRRAFGSKERFPNVDQLIQAWPDEAFARLELNESTAVAVLTHDPKIDDPALQLVLPSPAFYVGALGSATTQARRRTRLLDAGLSETQLARLHGPIGLKLGGQTPQEIALAILAEIVAVQHGALEQKISSQAVTA
jgi:xanthine dehydrogenase accessory factor